MPTKIQNLLTKKFENSIYFNKSRKYLAKRKIFLPIEATHAPAYTYTRSLGTRGT